jgi:hypothetical protein
MPSWSVSTADLSVMNLTNRSTASSRASMDFSYLLLDIGTSSTSVSVLRSCDANESLEIFGKCPLIGASARSNFEIIYSRVGYCAACRCLSIAACSCATSHFCTLARR